MIAMLPSWFAWSASVAVIGWLAFAATKAPGIVGLVFAVRLAPLVLLGVPIGTLSELRELSLTHAKLTNITGLKPLTQLRELGLVGNHVTDLTPLSGMKANRRRNASTSARWACGVAVRSFSRRFRWSS